MNCHANRYIFSIIYCIQVCYCPTALISSCGQHHDYPKTQQQQRAFQRMQCSLCASVCVLSNKTPANDLLSAGSLYRANDPALLSQTVQILLIWHSRMQPCHCVISLSCSSVKWFVGQTLATSGTLTQALFEIQIHHWKNVTSFFGCSSSNCRSHAVISHWRLLLL